MKKKLPNSQYIEDYVKKVVEEENPLGIILFGSIIREEVLEDSDLDVVVIYEDKIDLKEKGLPLRMLDEVELIEPFPYG